MVALIALSRITIYFIAINHSALKDKRAAETAFSFPDRTLQNNFKSLSSGDYLNVSNYVVNICGLGYKQ